MTDLLSNDDCQSLHQQEYVDWFRNGFIVKNPGLLPDDKFEFEKVKVKKNNNEEEEDGVIAAAFVLDRDYLLNDMLGWLTAFPEPILLRSGTFIHFELITRTRYRGQIITSYIQKKLEFHQRLKVGGNQFQIPSRVTSFYFVMFYNGVDPIDVRNQLNMILSEEQGLSVHVSYDQMILWAITLKLENLEREREEEREIRAREAREIAERVKEAAKGVNELNAKIEKETDIKTTRNDSENSPEKDDSKT